MSDEMDNAEWLRKSSQEEWCGSALNKCADEITRLREENARLRRIVKIAYAEGCYDISKTEKTQEEFEALWRRTFSYKIISGRGKDEAP